MLYQQQSVHRLSCQPEQRQINTNYSNYNNSIELTDVDTAAYELEVEDADYSDVAYYTCKVSFKLNGVEKPLLVL